MKEYSSEHGSSSSVPAEQRVVYIALPPRTDDELDLVAFIRLMWAKRWFIVAFTSVVVVLAVIYSLLATEQFRAEVLLSPAAESATSGLGGQLGGLAALAGVSLGKQNTAEAIAVLNSRDFARRFIEDKQLLPTLSAASGGTDGEGLLDIREAVKLFRNNIMSVEEKKDTGQVILSVQWTDPQVAADWANELAIRLNEQMRQRALKEAEANVAYLRKELSDTTIITLQQPIARLLETELQKLMLARGNEEFSYRVIDPAEPPLLRAWPKRTLIVLLAAVFGGVLAVFIAFFAHVLKERSAAATARGSHQT